MPLAGFEGRHGERSPGVAEAGGDAIDGCGEGVVQVVVVLTTALASQQLNLNQTQRIDIRIAQTNRTRKHGVFLEQCCLSSQTQDHLFCALKLLEEHAEHLLSQRSIRNQPRIQTRNRQISLRQSHLNVRDQLTEEWKLI